MYGGIFDAGASWIKNPSKPHFKPHFFVTPSQGFWPDQSLNSVLCSAISRVMRIRIIRSRS
jgi:hypothetical protein